MRKLHSENIVRFIDVVETENNFYIVQEYCNGGDLRTKLNKEKQFSEAIATEYLTQLLNGFIELMTNGVIHRDMKPENILINNKKAKIADFGFAKNVLSRSQLLRTLVGTPLYMSLQMLKNDKYTSKCDIWALGLLYYEMLYGRVPWSGKS
jgi:serine/threonine protein kinase